MKKLSLVGAVLLALGLAGLIGASAAPPYTGNTTGTDSAAILNTLTDTYTAVIAARPAGENHIGEVGSNSHVIVVPQTVTASSAYTSGNAVGGLITIANAARVSGSAGASGTSGLLQSVSVDAKSAQTTQMDLLLFNANPSGTTCTDKTALAVAAADWNKWIGTAHITDWTSGGTPSMGQAQNLAMPYVLASSTTLYGCLVTRSTPTFTATTDISVNFHVLRN
jgi:hypothetical protein